MDSMYKFRFALAAAAGLAVFALLAFGQEDPVIARGKYLAEEVARCQDCHTPKMANGTYIRSQWMKGSTISVMPAAPVTGWKSAAPDITPNGPVWKRWNDEGMINFLVTGKSPRGGKAGSPMPTYNLKKEDAEAIVAFLKTIQ